MHKPYLLATLVYLTFLAIIVILANNAPTAPEPIIAESYPDGGVNRLFKFVGSFSFGDKAAHFFLMGFFSFLFNSALRCREIKVRGTKLLLGSLIVCIVVLSEEVSQVFVESRDSDLLDMLFDVVGIYLFGILARSIMSASLSARP